ncbi:MAG: TlpA disulfide reductase family protein [Bryobacteraceae bacterium]
MISTSARISAMLLILAGMATAADPPGIHAALVPAGKRHSAADFALPDASGRTANLRDYRGKVVLLDFWATWCTGCKEEIPSFSEFQKKYGAKGFAMVGVSLDDGGWKVLKPFLASHNVPYRMLLGDDRIAQRYGIQSMPDTFLIDRSGRVAAAYTGGLVDKDDVETNTKAVLDRR